MTVRRSIIKSSNTAIAKNLSAAEANEILSSLIKNIYTRFFDYVVSALNRGMNESAILGGRQKHVGILDIYGFEALDVNSLEQLCINL